MKYKFRTAPFFLIERSETLGTAIDRMLDSSTTYLVVVDRDKKLSGIFTRSDVFKKCKLFHDKEILTKPIGSVCSVPVKTITSNLIHTAPSVMLKHNISHLPVVDYSDGKQVLVGVLTERSIFEMIVKMKGLPDAIGGSFNLGQKDRRVAVISPDGTSFEALKSVFQVSKNLSVQRYWIANLTTQESLKRAALENDAIIMDIDGAPDLRWKEILKYFYDHSGLENICILFDPSQHPLNIKTLFSKLEGVGWLHVYQKPMDIASMILDLENVWASGD